MSPLSGRFAAFALSLLLAACGGGGGASSTATSPAPPVTTPPVVTPPVTTPPVVTPPSPYALWTAPVGATPATGNYVYLQSDGGDYIGAGRSYSYSDANAMLALSSSGLAVNMNVQGNETWAGRFLLPRGAGTLQTGYYLDLMGTPFADPVVGGVEWSGEGRGCNTIKGWLAIDKVTVNAGVVEAIDLRFEQRCEGGSTALHGQIHWSKAGVNNNLPLGPQAIPASLWQPAASILPSSGNYVYLESRPGDFVGAGRSYLYTPSNAMLSMTAVTARVSMRVAGDQNWTADFQGMNSLGQLGVGLYAGLMRYPFHNPVTGGLDWSGDGRGCNKLDGWFAVDKITYTGVNVTALDLRFAQYCDGSSSPLYGKVHWDANDASTLPGPQTPPPAGLWKPDASFVAPSGNYVYLASQSGDYIGQGRTELLTSSTATITASGSPILFTINAGGWQGDFVGMNSLTQLTPGYYGDLQRYPFHNVVKGGLDWSGNGRGCNQLAGWFVVDQVSYAQGALSSIDLRFEQHCDGSFAAQRGQIHWSH